MTSSTTSAVRRAVAELIDAAGRSARGTRPAGDPPGEVAFLRALFNEVVRKLDDALEPGLTPFALRSSTAGIFVHQRPYVTFDTPPGCELGDLLILVYDLDDPRSGGQALLLQGKIGRMPLRVRSGGSEAAQWRLYATRTMFTWRHRMFHWRVGGRGRRSLGPRPHAGAQYLGIERGAAGTASFGIALPDALHQAGTAGSTLLADAIVELVLRREGRPFHSLSQSVRVRGWTRVIWELIESWSPSSDERRAGRYAGIDAFRVGETAPVLLMQSFPGDGVGELWDALPPLPAAAGRDDVGDSADTSGPSELGAGDDLATDGGDGAAIVEPDDDDLPAPPRISTIFIGIGRADQHD